MKRRVIWIYMAVLILLFGVLPVSANAAPNQTILMENGSTITYFSDGSTLTVSPIHTVEVQAIERATSKTVTADKVATYKDSAGNVEWKYTLTATFSYVSGVSATCTNASYTQTISGSGWSFSNGSATKSGNVATGKGTFKHKVLFITTTTHNVNITLTCDKYGNVT